MNLLLETMLLLRSPPVRVTRDVGLAPLDMDPTHVVRVPRTLVVRLVECLVTLWL